MIKYHFPCMIDQFTN